MMALLNRRFWRAMAKLAMRRWRKPRAARTETTSSGAGAKEKGLVKSIGWGLVEGLWTGWGVVSWWRINHISSLHWQTYWQLINQPTNPPVPSAQPQLQHGCHPAQVWHIGVVSMEHVSSGMWRWTTNARGEAVTGAAVGAELGADFGESMEPPKLWLV